MRVYFRRAFSTVRPEPQHAGKWCCCSTLSLSFFFFFFLPEKLTSLGTRRIFNEEHDALREVARNFFQTRVVPFHSKWEEEGQIPRQTWKEAGERGLLCMTMPGEYGGLGQDILSAAIGWCDCDFWFLFFFFFVCFVLYVLVFGFLLFCFVLFRFEFDLLNVISGHMWLTFSSQGRAILHALYGSWIQLAL